MAMQSAIEIEGEAADLLADVPMGDALLLQDYGKGVCARQLLSRLTQFALTESVPVLVDPARSRNWSDYVDVTLIKANWAEATEQGPPSSGPKGLARRLSDVHTTATLSSRWANAVSCVPSAAERHGTCQRILVTCVTSAARRTPCWPR